MFCRAIGFRASHYYWLPDLTDSENRAMFGPSSVAHPHDWVLTVWLEGPVDPRTGMMVDLLAVDAVLKEKVYDRFAGKVINDCDGFFKQHQPTNEVLAGYFAEMLGASFDGAKLAKLRIAEAPDLFAEWWA
jgi:6-pyruvoyltetrahydropterin/6-carboxytetrahydropterin synthase